jgi:hypothetical protein
MIRIEVLISLSVTGASADSPKRTSTDERLVATTIDHVGVSFGKTNARQWGGWERRTLELDDFDAKVPKMGHSESPKEL